jgi:hypothetical protein
MIGLVWLGPEEYIQNVADSLQVHMKSKLDFEWLRESCNRRTSGEMSIHFALRKNTELWIAVRLNDFDGVFSVRLRMRVFALILYVILSINFIHVQKKKERKKERNYGLFIYWKHLPAIGSRNYAQPHLRHHFCISYPISQTRILDWSTCHVMILMLTKLLDKIIILVVTSAADPVCSSLFNTKKLPFVRI